METESDASARLAELARLVGTERLDRIVATGLASLLRGDEALRLGELAITAAANTLRKGGPGTEVLAQLTAILGPLDRALPLGVLLRDDDDEHDDDGGLASGDRLLVDVAIVELALSLGVPLRLPGGEPRTYTFWPYRWGERAPLGGLDELSRVGAHPFFGEVLVASFLPTRESQTDAGQWLGRAAGRAGFDRVFAAIDAFVATIDETWTVGAYGRHEAWLESLVHGPVLARCPRLAPAPWALSPARLLQNQLRAGLTDEWARDGEKPDDCEEEPDHDGQSALVSLEPSEWLRARLDDAERPVAVVSYTCAVPPAAETSPLGVKNGLGGFALVRRGGQVRAEDIAGRRASGFVNGKTVSGLMTFPARTGLHPIIDRGSAPVRDQRDHGIALPDGTTPLVPCGELEHYGIMRLPRSLRLWYSLRPRDVAASQALSRCSEAAASLLSKA